MGLYRAARCEANPCSCTDKLSEFACGDTACGGEQQHCCVECVVQKVVLHRRAQKTPVLQWLLGGKELIFVEIFPIGGESMRRRTGMGRQAEEPPATSSANETWVWEPSAQDKLDNAAAGIPLNSSCRLVFERALTITEFSVAVLKQNKGWLPGSSGEVDAAALELQGEARFQVDEDVVAQLGVQGELTLPLVLNSRVCGSISLMVSLHTSAPLKSLAGHISQTASKMHKGLRPQDIEVPAGPWRAVAPKVELVKVGSHPVPTHPIRLEGHKDTVSCCAMFPSGGRVLTGSYDKTGIIWSDQGEQFAILRGHSGKVTSCRVFPSEDQVITVSEEEAVGIIWSLVGERCAVLQGARSCELFPSGDRVLTAWSGEKSGEGAAIFSKAGELLMTHLGHADYVRACAVFPSGDQLLSSSGKEAVVWTTTGKTLKVLRGHTSVITACAVFPDDIRIVTVSKDTRGIIWRTGKSAVQVEKQSVVLRGHGSGINDCAVMPRIKAVLTVADDKRAIIWSCTGDMLADFKGHDAPLVACAVFPKGEGVLTVSSDGAGIVWTFTPGALRMDGTVRQRGELRGHLRAIRACAAPPLGDRVLTVSEDHTGMIWPVAQLFDDFPGRRVQCA